MCLPVCTIRHAFVAATNCFQEILKSIFSGIAICVGPEPLRIRD
jgi:hypothetical protein